jgi:hypothetical protein
VVKKRKGPRIAAAAIAATCLVGSGVFAYASLSGGDGGASSPEAATQAFFDALGDEDVIGMLNTLPAGERRTMVPLLQETVSELGRLELLSGDADPSKVAGVDFEFTDLTFETDELAPDVVAVTLTDGRFSGSYDLAQLPLGQALIDQAFDGEAPEGTDRGEESLADAAFPTLTTIQDDDGWHVSLWYSVAEAARQEAGLPVPEFGNGIEARGAESPEQAVEALFDALADLDVRRLIELSPPDEMAALHDYAPLFIDDAERSIDELLGESDFEADLVPTNMEVEDADGRKVVRVSGVEGSASADGETIEFGFADGCGFVEVQGDRQEGCVADLREQASDELSAEMAELADRLSDPSLPLATIEADGGWYISPTFTLGGFMLDLLRAAEPGDVGDMFNAADAGMDSGFELGASLNNDVLGGLSGPGTGTGFDDVEEDPFDSTSTTAPADTGATAGYDRYYETCGDIEYGVISAETAEEWTAAQAAAVACAEPFLSAGDIIPADLYEEVAYPQCYTAWPYDPNITLSEQSVLFDQIDACVEAAG